MNNYKNKYESLVSSIKIKDITSNEENARILQSLRNNDSTYERMCLFSHHEDSGDFVLGDDMDEIAWFGYFLGNNTKIEDFEIKLPEQIIRDQGFEVSEEAISNITKLFCGGLNRNRSIKKLTFYGDLGNGDIFTWLMPFFQNNDKITDVVVDDGDDEPIKLKCCRKIALALRSTKLRHLNLSYNGMQFSGAEILARALTSNKSLHTLDLHENSIGDAGVDSFTRALANMHTLRVLDLGIDRKKSEFAKIEEAIRESGLQLREARDEVAAGGQTEVEGLTRQLEERKAALEAVESEMDELEVKRVEKERQLEVAGERHRVAEARILPVDERLAGFRGKIDEQERVLAALAEEIQEKKREAQVLQTANSLHRRARNQERESDTSRANQLERLSRELEDRKRMIAESEVRIVEANEELARLTEEIDRQQENALQQGIAHEENLSVVTRKIAERAEELAMIETTCREKRREVDELKVRMRRQIESADGGGDATRELSDGGYQKYAISETAAALQEAGFTTIAVSCPRSRPGDQAEGSSSEDV